jgi:hypothetical protein
LGNELVEDLRKNRVHQKFDRLHECADGRQEAEGYRDLVLRDLGYLRGRVSTLREGIESALDLVRSVLASNSQDTGQVLVSFQSFVEDLLADTVRLEKIVTEGSKFSKVPCLGRLYDAVASRFHDYEVAGRFVQMMADRLHSEK